VPQLLKVLLDIVLWRRGPQDLPASPLLLALAVVAYVGVSLVQLSLLDEPPGAWTLFVFGDPLLLGAGTWLVLRLFRHPERFLQTATAVFGTGALLGIALYLPVQVLLAGAAESTAGLVVAFGLVAVFALVTGRILKLATETSLVTGIAIALTYFLLMDLLVGYVVRGGS
jgi:hypothetical protein